MSTGNQDLILGVSVDASDASRGFEQVSRDANKMAGEVAQASIKAGKGIDGIGDGAATSANNLDKATRNMIGSIQRTTAAMEAGQRGTTKYYEAIANQRGVSQDALRPYLAQLDQAIDKQKQASASMNSMGLSAGQLSNAMRGVPAQFTDIVVSLQSGQAPMTVLLQQGGQLKDMFGGIGNAAKALGGYALGLISPFTVLAAGVGTLGIAAYQGSKEAHELAKALIMTGNAAGTSVDQLKNMASAVSEATGATKGAAVDALTQIAASGKVAASNMGLVAEAAIAMQKATGAAVEDTVKQFSELGKSPVEASLKLNEQYNYLTASVYRQIKALEDQGRQTEAVTLAQETYAKSVKEQANQIRQDLGGLESAWKSVGNFAKSAWDKMLNVGREGSISDQIATLKKQLTTGSFDFALTEGDIKSQIASLEKKLASETQVTAEKAKQSELDRYGIEWAKEGDKYLSKKQQMEQEITKARNQGIAAGASELEITKRIAAIREKFTEKTSRSGKSQIEKDADALKVLLDKLHGTEDNAFSSDYVTNVEKLIKGWSAGTLKIQQFRVEMGRLVAMQPGVKALAKETEELAKTRDKYAQGISKETESLIKKAEAAEYENAKIGMTADQLEYLTRARYADEIATKQNEAAMIESIWGRNSEVEAIEKQIDALKRLQGAEVARPKLQAQAKEWEKFSDDINRALTDALMRGFEDGKSFGQNFVDSLKNSLKTAALKIVVNMVTSTGGSLANAAINAVAGTSSANDGAGANYFGLANNANSVYSLYGAGTQFFTGASTGSSSAGLIYANGTQMVGGDGIGALYTANGGWAGVDAGTGAASGAVAGEGAGAGAGATAGYIAAVFAAEYLIFQALTTSKTRYLDTQIQGKIDAAGGFNGEMTDRYKYTGNLLDAGGYDTSTRLLTGDVGQLSNYYASRVTNQADPELLAATGYLRGANDPVGYDDMQNQLFAPWSEAEIAEARKRYLDVAASGVNPAVYGFSNGTQTQYLTASGDSVSQEAQFNGAIKSAFEGMYKAAKTSLLGIGAMFEDTSIADSLANFTKDINMKFSGSLSDSMKTFGDTLLVEMGSAWLPSVEALRASGETWSQSLSRLVSESSAFGQILLAMGTTMKDAFGQNQTDAILRASDSLVKLFGSVDKLGESFGAYYQNFYTQEEISKKAMESLTAQFTSVGLVIPSTRAEFRKMVDSLDLTTTSGQSTFKSLMDLQAGFANLVPAMTDVAAATTEIIDAAGRKSWGDKLAVLTGQKTQTQVDRDNTIASTSDAAVQAIMRLVFAQEDLKAASETAAAALTAALQTQADAIITTYGDVVSAMAEINPPAKTLVDSWRENKTALEGLQSVFDQFFGQSLPDAGANIQALLTQMDAFKNGASTARGNADNARLQGMTPTERAAYWRNQESSLWQGLGQSTDKAGTINKIIAAYGNTRTAELEQLTADQSKLNDTQKTGLQAQIDTWKTTLSVIEKAQGFAKSLEQFMGSLAFSDLSALGYTDQLGAAQSLYGTTLAGVKGNDPEAMGNFTGNAQAYLEEAQKYYGGASLDYATIYKQVTGDAGSLGMSLNTDGTGAKSEIDRLTESLNGLTTTLPTDIATAFSNETADGYGRIETALTAGTDYTRGQMDEQKALLQQQIAQQQEIIANQQAQIEQQAALHAELMAQQAAQTARLTALESNASLAGAGA